jgi:hypothetical protein
MVETKPVTFNHDSLANPINNYILDLESGAELVASPDAFKQAMGTGANGANSVWIAISKRSIRSQVNFSGEKLAKVDLVETDEVCRAVVLTKNGKFDPGVSTMLTVSRPARFDDRCQEWICQLLQSAVVGVRVSAGPESGCPSVSRHCLLMDSAHSLQ